MRLKWFVWLFPLLILLSALPAYAALPEPTILLNGRPMTLPADQRPVIVAGRTLVPMRALFEALGATITWDDATRTVTAVKGETVVTLMVDAAEARVGERSVPIDPPAQLVGGRTYVPLRAVVDLLGARVGWDGETATIRITDRRAAVGGELTFPVGTPSIYLPDFPPDSPNLAMRALFGDGLLRYSAADMSYEPALAAAMPEFSEDGRTVTFRLRKGITFHDGREVTAVDFLFSYALVARYKISDGSFSIESVAAPDAHTVVISTKTPHAPGVLLMASAPPLPYHLLKGVTLDTLSEHPFWKAPVGAGPYQFASQSRELLTLRRYPEFWEAKINPEIGPWLEQLSFAYVPYGSEDERYANGRVDFYQGAPGADLEAVMAQRESSLYQWQRFGYGSFTLNTQMWPTNIKEVRQALTLALDRKTLVKKALGGAAVLPNGPLPDYHWIGDLPDPYPYDPQAAIALMEQAGFTRNAEGLFEKDGKVASVLVTMAYSPLTEAIAHVAAENWRAIGIDLDIRLMDFYYLMEQHLRPGNFNVFFMGFSASADPYFTYRMWSQQAISLTTSGNTAGLNHGRYTNPRLESLLDEMKVAATQERQIELAHQTLAILQEDAPTIWLYSNIYGQLLPAEVQGVAVKAGSGIGRPEYWYLRTE